MKKTVDVITVAASAYIPPPLLGDRLLAIILDDLVKLTRHLLMKRPVVLLLVIRTLVRYTVCPLVSQTNLMAPKALLSFEFTKYVTSIEIIHLIFIKVEIKFKRFLV